MFWVIIKLVSILQIPPKCYWWIRMRKYTTCVSEDKGVSVLYWIKMRYNSWEGRKIRYVVKLIYFIIFRQYWESNIPFNNRIIIILLWILHSTLNYLKFKVNLPYLNSIISVFNIFLMMVPLFLSQEPLI